MRVNKTNLEDEAKARARARAATKLSSRSSSASYLDYSEDFSWRFSCGPLAPGETRGSWMGPSRYGRVFPNRESRTSHGDDEDNDGPRPRNASPTCARCAPSVLVTARRAQIPTARAQLSLCHKISRKGLQPALPRGGGIPPRQRADIQIYGNAATRLARGYQYYYYRKEQRFHKRRESNK